MVSLTGDTATGKEIAAAAAQTVKRVHLELGGKAPVVVFDDADLSAVAEAVKLAGFFNSGQDCTAATRIIASKRIYDNLLAELLPAVESLKVGDPATAEDARHGPAGQRRPARTRGWIRRPGTRLRRECRHRRQARTAGAKGFFYDPTVVTDIAQDSEIIQQEVFGPVVTVQHFDDDDEAIRWANGVPYGLASIGLDARRQAGAQRGTPAALRHGVDQRSPDDRLGDAPRWLRPVGLRQGHEHATRSRTTRSSSTSWPRSADARPTGRRRDSRRGDRADRRRS